jgi:hypothetical protein
VFSVFELIEYLYKKWDKVRFEKKTITTTTEVQAFEKTSVSNNKY